MIESQLFQGLIDGGYGLVVVLNLRGELRRHEELVPGESGGADSFVDFSLVTIGLGGIEVSVTDVHGIPYRLRGFIVVNKPGAEAQLGNLNTACQGVGFLQDSHAFAPFVGSSRNTSAQTDSRHALGKCSAVSCLRRG